MADDTTLDLPGTDDAPQPDSRADDIAAAFEQVESRDAPATDAKQPGVSAPDTPGAPADRVRGADGRFVPTAAPKADKTAQDALQPKPGAAPASKQPLGAQKPATPAAAADPGGKQPAADAAPAPAAIRAPASWKIQAREHWAKLPAEVQQEVSRREQEVGRALQDSAKAREALSHVQGVLGPYAANIQASGNDAIGAIQNFFQADNTLRHGSNSDKAQMVANIIKNYGVDIVALDSVLAGQSVAPDPTAQVADQLRRELAAQLKPVMGYFNQVQGQRSAAMQQLQQNAGSEVEQFGADDAHEFFDDVRTDMADIIDLYTARGQTISLQDAYDRAIMLHPQVREVVAKRAEAERTNNAAQAAQRARRAAASITSSPAPAGSPGPAGLDRRAEIEAAWDQASGG